MDFKSKYLKYKKKYLDLKASGGATFGQDEPRSGRRTGRQSAQASEPRRQTQQDEPRSGRQSAQASEPRRQAQQDEPEVVDELVDKALKQMNQKW